MKRRDFLSRVAALPVVLAGSPQGPPAAPNGDGGPATQARLSYPNTVSVDSAGNFYIVDSDRGSVRKVTASTGVIDTVAGGARGYGGDGGPAISAQLMNPEDIAVDAAGSIYIADMSNSRIRKVTPDGVIRTVVQVINPRGVALDVEGNLYILQLNNIVSRMAAGTNRTLAVAGNGYRGFSGDGGPAIAGQIGPSAPGGLAVDASGNLYIADGNNQRIRRVTSGGVITTIAGNGTAGYSGDGGPASSAQLSGPTGVAVDPSGNLYVADAENSRIRKVTPDGLIHTVAGNGKSGFGGDGGPATSAQLNGPTGVAVDTAGNLYIADRLNARIRKVTPDGTIRTVTGSVLPPGVIFGAPAR